MCLYKLISEKLLNTFLYYWFQISNCSNWRIGNNPRYVYTIIYIEVKPFINIRKENNWFVFCYIIPLIIINNNIYIFNDNVNNLWNSIDSTARIAQKLWKVLSFKYFVL